MSNSLRPHGLYGPWDSPGQNTGVGSLSLLQAIFPTQESNPHCRQILYQLIFPLQEKAEYMCTSAIMLLFSSSGCPVGHAGYQFSHQGSNPCPRHWQHGVLTTGLPGRSLHLSLYCVVSESVFREFSTSVRADKPFSWKGKWIVT